MSFSQVMRHDFPEEVPRPGRLAALRERIRHIEQPASHGVLPFGVAAIDRVLPDGGLALGAVHEILGIDGDEEDGAAACGFIAGLLARLRMAPRDEDILWAIEEGLRAPGLVAVIGEIGRLPLVAGRRLQLAAERSGITAFLLRRWRNSEEAARERERPSAAVTRWRIAALPARDIDDPRLRQLIGQPRWRVELLRCRGGVPAQWVVESGVVESGDVEVADATGHVRLSPELADRPAAAVDRKEGRLAAEPRLRFG